MAAENCTVFAVRGQALRVYGCIKDATTGNPIVTIGTLSATISKDGGTGASATTPVAVASHNGMFYVDLTASECTAYHAALTVSSSTADQISATIFITFVDLSETFTGHWLSHTIIKLERGIMQACGYLVSKVKRNKTSGLITAYHRDESTVIGTMDYADDGTDVTKGTIEAP